MGDYLRVVQGARMVLQHAVRRNGPELQRRFDRAVFHLSELVKIASETIQHHQQSSSHSSQSEQASSKSKASDDQSTSYGTTTASPKPPYDPIGFDKIEDIGIDSKLEQVLEESPAAAKSMRARAVPSTQLGRMMGFGSLAMRIALGEAASRASNLVTGSAGSGGGSLSEASAEVLAESLCRMRGAALKLGQMLSIQDEASLPPALTKALDRVKQAADYMPARQLESQLASQWGADWRGRLLQFSPVPLAAASIGQVHRAVVCHDGEDVEVAVKVQYPGVAESIESDLQNLRSLVGITGLVPPGLFIDNIIAVASRELKEECDYQTEAASQAKYRELVLADPVLRRHVSVPEVLRALCTERVLVSRLVQGVPVDQAVKHSQPVRNAIARTVLLATVRELFAWRFVQSDPNFANFLYDHSARTVHMIDFGAARSYSKAFVDNYIRLVWAAANRDRETILVVSRQLGFLTGDEAAEFVHAHVEAGLVVGEPFVSPEPFDFANSALTQRISQYGSIFMKHRLTPPPSEVYSLHRKLAGAFLLCIKLQAKIPCRDILEDTYRLYQFG